MYKENKMKKVIGYIRVSTEYQKLKENSINIYLRKCMISNFVLNALLMSANFSITNLTNHYNV